MISINYNYVCPVKNPEDRASATELLQHPFTHSAHSPTVLLPVIEEAKELREKLLKAKVLYYYYFSVIDRFHL